jgi:hypothetical protein
MSWWSQFWGFRGRDTTAMQVSNILAVVNRGGVLDAMVTAAIPHIKALESSPVPGTSKRTQVFDIVSQLFKAELPILGTAAVNLAIELGLSWVRSQSKLRA